ncbi:zinc finger and SCAN domain-containing protein 23-like [Leptidea sinapis]|uniref:zinc finger and SCAN domain-containing protein 23-like n=1 Tax=Leptidea sinapis TaxID=189913 RepID=UPI00213E9EE4|nr:zinc finger and SCAN domain-containing protein 23-like [Leptidea sinapis]
MNFTPFTGHVPVVTTLPTIHQFAAKFGYEGSGSMANTGVVQETRYHSGTGVQFAVNPTAGDGMRFRQGESVVVMSSNGQPGSVTLAGLGAMTPGVKYQTITSSSSSLNVGNISYGGHTYIQADELKADKREYREELQQDIMTSMMQQQQVTVHQAPLQQGTQQLLVVLHEPKEAAALARVFKQEMRPGSAEFISIADVGEGASWQAVGGGVADYLAALPLPLHHLLKYSSVEKRDDHATFIASVNTSPLSNVHTISPQEGSVLVQNTNVLTPNLVMCTQTPNSPETNSSSSLYYNNGRKKKKKKDSEEKKPRPKPGEIRITTALDGSTLYCCPECHMAYPERDLVEEHLVGHTMERKFICDICNAALKRKDHLTRHKQSHNAERPFICSVCMKAFKRKEQLTLHFIIHSGEKRHVCNECGKGFYRKDHLRKHTRSHIARRVKAELSQETTSQKTSKQTQTATKECS